jgi:hypothetical protein
LAANASFCLPQKISGARQESYSRSLVLLSSPWAKSFNSQSSALDFVQSRTLAERFNTDVGQAMLNVMTSILVVDAPAPHARGLASRGRKRTDLLGGKSFYRKWRLGAFMAKFILKGNTSVDPRLRRQREV